MRILFWQEAFWPQVGGIQTQAEWFLPALRRRGHDVVVVTRQDLDDRPGVDQWDGFPVYRYPFWQALDRRNPRAILTLKSLIEQLQHEVAPDILHLSGFGPTALFALHARRTRPVPLLVALHSSNTLTATGATLLAYTLASADWVSACSRALLDDARRCAPDIERHASVVHNGVLMPTLEPAPLPFAPASVLCLGHLADHKGYDLLLEAVPILLARLPDLRFTIAGDGPARAVLERRARPLAAAVTFCGQVSRTEVAAFINRATLVVVPSRRESFGLVAVEAALLQRPVVAAHVGGLPEIVVHEKTGLLVEPDNPVALAAAIARILTEPTTATQMGAAGRAHAQRHFTLDRQCDAYEAIYQRVASPAAERRPGVPAATTEPPRCG